MQLRAAWCDPKYGSISFEVAANDAEMSRARMREMEQYCTYTGTDIQDAAEIKHRTSIRSGNDYHESP